MRVDGKELAMRLLQQLTNQVSHSSTKPHLTIFTCAPTAETKTYLRMKSRRAGEVGIAVNVVEWPAHMHAEDMVRSINSAVMLTDGIVVQLPLPKSIDRDAVLAAIPAQCDVDGLNYAQHPSTSSLPPVAAAIAHIARYHEITFYNKNVVIVGYGRLVGQPCATYFEQQDAQVQVVTEVTPHADQAIKAADILILGAGQPGLITPDKIKEGVILFDAGTSELGGQLYGDAHPDCQHKAALFTPVPGGIGPLTIATLLENVVHKVIT